MNVLFVCVGNQGRSVMAERLFRQAVGERHSARSAGSAPGSATHLSVLENSPGARKAFWARADRLISAVTR